MPTIKPFRALRPKPELAQLVSSKSWDSNHNHVSREIMADYEHSYLHVVKPHLNFTDPERIPEKHYPFARQKFQHMKELGVLEEEEQACFYLYQVTDQRNGNEYAGIVGAASVDDYLADRIKKHENTLSKKEDALVLHVEYVKAVGEPVLLTFNGGQWYDDLITKVKARASLFSFIGDEGTKTEVWTICDSAEQELIEKELAQLPAFYIADGHHRSAGAVNYCLKRRAENPGYTGNEKFNYFLSYFIPTDKIRIFEFNRLVKDLNGLSAEAFLQQLAESFTVTHIGKARLKVKKKQHTFGMYLDKEWYGLDLKPGSHAPKDVLGQLDVSLIEDLVLKPILGIRDSKTDDRLSFLDGTKGITRLQELVDIGEFRVAFSLFPTRVEEVLEVADNALTMPPKSTWFEPKLRTGLLIYEL